MLHHHQRRDMMLAIWCQTLLSALRTEFWMECSVHTWCRERGGAQHVRALGSARRLQAVEARASNLLPDVSEEEQDGSDVREFLSTAVASAPRRAAQSDHPATSAPPGCSPCSPLHRGFISTWADPTHWLLYHSTPTNDARAVPPLAFNDL